MFGGCLMAAATIWVGSVGNGWTPAMEAGIQFWQDQGVNIVQVDDRVDAQIEVVRKPLRPKTVAGATYPFVTDEGRPDGGLIWLAKGIKLSRDGRARVAAHEIGHAIGIARHTKGPTLMDAQASSWRLHDYNTCKEN